MKLPENSAFSPAQETVALALAAGKKIVAVAAEHMITERTVYKWLEKPEFRELVANLRRRATDAAIGRMSDASADAVTTLVDLTGPQNDPAIRLKAAQTILDTLIRYRDQTSNIKTFDDFLMHCLDA